MLKFAHTNFNVLDLNRSIKFYKEALGLSEVSRIDFGDFILLYLGDGKSDYTLELTWRADKKTPYELGDNKTHIAFTTEDFDKVHELHKKMGCICRENLDMGIYFINDPDGYLIEILGG